MNKIHILSRGYSRIDAANGEISYANGSSTLVQTFSGQNIIVDTLTSWNGDHLQSYLSEYNLQPKDIHYVVCTHGHADHIGCNYLFLDAIWHFVGTTLSKGDLFLKWDTSKPFTLIQNNANDNTVQVVYTPGHTNSCVSVVAYNTQLGTIGICGDLFENEHDIWDKQIWLDAGSEYPHKQLVNRSKMIQCCDYIVPGHGEMFKVTEAMRIKVKKDEKEPLMIEVTEISNKVV